MPLDKLDPALDDKIGQLMTLANEVALALGKECTPDGSIVFHRAISEGSDITLEIVVWPQPELRLYAADLNGQQYVLGKVRRPTN